MKLKMIVEANIDLRDIHDATTIADDLIGDIIRVKSGMYNNQIFGHIISVETSDDTEETL